MKSIPSIDFLTDSSRKLHLLLDLYKEQQENNENLEQTKNEKRENIEKEIKQQENVEKEKKENNEKEEQNMKRIDKKRKEITEDLFEEINAAKLLQIKQSSVDEDDEIVAKKKNPAENYLRRSKRIKIVE